MRALIKVKADDEEKLYYYLVTLLIWVLIFDTDLPLVK